MDVKSQLKIYQWKGTHHSGKRMSGKILARHENEVRHQLKDQRIKIRKITVKNLSFIARSRQRASAKEITELTRQISTMLATGIPIVQILKLVAGNSNKAEMHSILMHITQHIEAGAPLASAMRSASPLFDNLYLALVTTGEQSGGLDVIFERIVIYREKTEKLKSQIFKALIYPSMVLLVSVMVSYIMLVFVIPQFESMFRGFGSELPWFTRKVLAVSEFTQNYMGRGVAMFIFLIMLIKFIRKRSERVRLLLGHISLRLPVIGPVIEKASIAKLSRTLATGVSAGIPILSSIKTSAATANHICFQYALNEVSRDTAAGMPLYIALRNTQIFPEIAIKMVMIGEESGRLDNMLNKLAIIYETEIDSTIDNLDKILEPLVVIILSILVGSLVIAMYLPIITLADVVG